ncbi:MAG TPA: PQQ-dependent sugar dehydrogenase, partial [Candidatus Limnocylindrales bacterium]
MPAVRSSTRTASTFVVAAVLAWLTFPPLVPSTRAADIAPSADAALASLADLPSNFVDELVFSGVTNPTNIEFATDGRVFVAEKSGRVLVFDNLSDTTATVFADLRTQTHNYWDRGLLGLALHPNFPATPWVYVSYTYDAAIGGTAPRWGTAGQTGDPCPNPPGATTDGCVVSSRVSRLTANGNASIGETVLVEDWCQQFPSHSIGDLEFGPDGALYVSGGDGADFNVVDFGQKGSPLNPCGDPPSGVGGVQTSPSAEGGALRSQDLRTSGDPVGLAGSILRIDPDTGAGLPGNPLFGNADPNARRIIAEGLRNPFRFTFRPGTDELWLGDVGWNTWEEVDRITDTTPNDPVNFGWPCYEGNGRQPGYDAANLTVCETLYGASGAVQSPFFTYSHSLDIAPPDDCPPAAPPAPVSSSVTGLAFYTGTAFPAIYSGALFGADYSRNCIWVMRADGNGVPDPSTIQGFQPAAQGPVVLKMGPDGSLYYANFNGGIRRIRYTVNLPPTANMTASPLGGPAPLDVSFDGTTSTDPEGHALSYAWDLDDDGTFNDGTGSTAAFTYTTTGQHRARLRVTDPGGEVDTEQVFIQVDNSLPAISITAPSASLQWSVGEDIAFAGTATDAQDGDISNQIDWDLTLFHCQGVLCHTHAITSWQDTAGATFSAPDHEYPSYLELKATVTDSSGATVSVTRRIDPKTVALTFLTSPAGLTVTVGGTSPQAAPFTRTMIVGSDNTVAVESPQLTGGGTSYTFASWSDGGGLSHSITAPATATSYTANFTPTAPSSCPDTLPVVTAAGWQRNGSATVAGTAVQLTPASAQAAGSVVYTS